MRNFVVIDFETATSYRHSVCQVAIVTVIDNIIVNKVSSLVKPKDNIYSNINIDIHGITPEKTKNSKSFDVVFKELILPELLKVQKLVNFNDKFIIAHNASFDRSVLRKALEEYKLNEIGIIDFCSESFWDCTHLLYRSKGYAPTKLNVLCEKFNIELNHHDALSDALACTKLYMAYNNGYNFK